jgi:regulator of RNase E activity RraB
MVVLGGCGPAPEVARSALIGDNQQVEPEYVLFTRTERGEPRVITARIPLPEEREKLPYAMTASLPYRSQPNGLPVTGELSRVTDLEQKVGAAIAARGAIYFGHITGGGQMRVFYYGPGAIEETITVKKGLLQKDEVKLESRQDPTWAVFGANLEPSPLEHEESRNLQLMQTLKQQGDNFAIPRPVDFSAFFDSAEAREAFLSEVEKQGFALGAGGKWQSEDGQFWCELVKTTSVEPNVIAQETLYLRETAQKHGGTFDGWATPVAK